MSNNTDERSPRFSRAILGRIIAVLAFVGLGTFAVMHSIIGSQAPQAEKFGNLLVQQFKQLQPNPAAQNSEPPVLNASGSGKETKQAVFNRPTTEVARNKNFGTPPAKTKIDVKTATNKSPETKNTLVGLPEKQEPQSSPVGEFKPKPKQNVSAAKPTTPVAQDSSFKAPGGFGASLGNKPPENDGGFKKSFEPPPRSFEANTAGNQSPILPTQPPVVRTASNQVPNKNPFDDGEFKPQRPVASKLNDSIAGAADKANQSFDQIKTKLSDSSENQTNGIRQKTTEFANELRSSKLGSGFGGNSLKTNDPQPANDTKPINTLQASQKTGINSNPTPFQTSPPTKTEPTIQLPSAANNMTSPRANPTGTFGNTPIRSQSQATPVNPSTGTSPLRNSPPPTNLSAKDFSATPAAPIQSMPQRQVPAIRTQPVSNSRIVSPLRNSNLQAEASATPGDRQLEGAQSPSITIQKIAPREIQVDTPADFQLVIKNNGRVSARNVMVTDKIPAGTEFVQASPQPTQNNGTLNWNLDTLRPGQEKRINIRLKPIRPGEIGSVAQVTFAAQASMRTLVTKPVLQIRHSIQPKILIGDNVAVDIVVENKGDGAATNVMIQEDVPAQLAFQEGFRELEYEVGRLEPGQSKRIQLTLKAAQIGRARNVLFASAAGNLRTQHATDFEVIAPKLVATGDGPKRKFLKRDASHKFTVENKGTAPATNVDLIAKLPNGLQFISANNQGKYDRNTHSVYWSMANLAPGIAASVDIKTTPRDTGEQTINFEARADLGQRTSIDKPLLVEHLIDVFFDIDDVVDPIEIGSGTSYRLRVVNQGTKTATNVRLVVDFPQGIRPTSVDGNLPHQLANNQIVFAPISSMNPGDELKLVVHGTGVAAGDHRVAVRLQTDGRDAGVSKEETTRVYNDR